MSSHALPFLKYFNLFFFLFFSSSSDEKSSKPDSKDDKGKYLQFAGIHHLINVSWDVSVNVMRFINREQVVLRVVEGTCGSVVSRQPQERLI